MIARRRDILIAASSLIAATTLPTLAFATSAGLAWKSDEVDWDEVINDVIDNRNEFEAGVKSTLIKWKAGSPHWCMEQEMKEILGMD